MGSTALVAKGRAGVVSENDEKAICLHSLKCRQEKTICYCGDFSYLIWKVM